MNEARNKKLADRLKQNIIRRKLADIEVACDTDKTNKPENKDNEKADTRNN